MQQSSACWWAVSPKQGPNKPKKQRQGGKNPRDYKENYSKGFSWLGGPKKPLIEKRKKTIQPKKACRIQKTRSQSLKVCKLLLLLLLLFLLLLLLLLLLLFIYS